MSSGAAAKVTPISEKSARIDMNYLVRALIKFNASDLHIKAGRPPLYRINGKLISAKMPDLSVEEVKNIIYGVLSERQIRELEDKFQIDLSFRVNDLGRFRCNVYHQRGTVSAAIRMIPFNVPNLDDLGAPSVLKELCQRPRGLLLITGATGSGKSTTLSALIQHLNETKHVHVITIEDPIEFIYRDYKASITQREVGSDMHSLQEGLYAGLRQDPDVIVIGEMRDYETMKVALTAAETGHLVMSTMHTIDAKSTVERILDVFPSDVQNQTRIQLASTLIGVVSQQLLVRADASGRVLASEVMIKSPSIENHIMRNELDRINDSIGTSNTYYKMHTMNQDLLRLVQQGVITADEALKSSSAPDNLRQQLSGIVRE